MQVEFFHIPQEIVLDTFKYIKKVLSFGFWFFPTGYKFLIIVLHKEQMVKHQKGLDVLTPFTTF